MFLFYDFLCGGNMDKEELIKTRTNFFKNILEQVRNPPSRMDSVLKQDKYYMPIDEENTFYEGEAGDLSICINGEFYGKNFNVYYSFWQVGDMLRIGIAVFDEDLQTAFTSDTHNEIAYIWGLRSEPRIDISHDCIYYDWEFDVPTLYNDYKGQEKYILGARHMHFRVMRILHDQCYRNYIFNQRETDYDPEVLNEVSQILNKDE
jgi:hypothetical protein